MDPEAPDRDNPYAPPSRETSVASREPWTLGGCMAAAVRTSVRAPVLAWVGLGVIPHLADPLGSLEVDGVVSNLVLLLLTCVAAAVLGGGYVKVALDLTRGEAASLRSYISYARFAPQVFVLYLPVFVPAALVYAGQPDDPSSVDELLMLLLIPVVLASVFCFYRLSLAAYALVDANAGLRAAAAHSWRRTGTNAAQFLGLSVVTSIPFAVTLVLSNDDPVTSTLFSMVTSPVVALCWSHAYAANARLDAARA